MDRDVELLQRRVQRERLARKAAEKIIEEKSRELYLKREELARTVVAERQARYEAEMLLQAFEIFTVRLDIDDVVGHLGEFIDRVIPHDGCAIYFFQEDELQLRGFRGDVMKGKVIGQSIKPTVLMDDLKKASQAILIADMKGNLYVRDWGIHRETKSWLAVPIAARGQNIGCLTLETRKEEGFGESAIRLVQALANEAAIALENARLFQEVEKLSSTDPLTGLNNRRKFNASARLEFQRTLRYGLQLSAIMMDIDHFKNVNDTYGHAAGDKVLVDVAAVCMGAIRAPDLHARYGGEELCFLLPETDIKGGRRLAERLRIAVAHLQFESEKGDFSVTASFGVAECLGGEDSIENLLKRSDQAMYEAKESGRNRVISWVNSENKQW